MQAVWLWLLIVAGLIAGCDRRVERPLKDRGGGGISFTHQPGDGH
jgi:hypothetical protein